MPDTFFVDAGGKKTQVTVGGEGPPLVYLHSAGGETDWMPFHEGLAQRYKVYLPAQPGFALSGGLEEIDDIHDMAWHLVDLFDALELETVPLVGFSLGAWLAAEFALLRPARVSRMVLVDAAGLHLPEAPMDELFIDDLEKLRKLLFFDSTSPVVELAMPTKIEDDRILMWLRAREATARVGWNPYLHNPKLAGHLHRIACPTLVLWGREDRLIPLAHGESYAESIPHARLEVFDSCGHMLPFEKEKEFVKTTLEFLANG